MMNQVITTAIAQNELAILGARIAGYGLLEAVDRERREFTKNGKVYRVTDYDTSLGRRVPVPFAEAGEATNPSDVYFDFGAISRLVDSGKEGVLNFLDDAFGKPSQDFRHFLAELPPQFSAKRMD